VVRAAKQALEAVGAPTVGLDLNCTNAIPHGRGLGSSAAAVAAGCLIARGLIDHPTSMNAGRIFEITTGFEGHPDNAAPVVFGGATIAWMEAKCARVAHLTVHPEVAAVVLVPQDAVSTAEARAALPLQVPHKDAAFNAARSALMVHALTKAPDMLFEASADRLHQPYRTEVMPPTAALVAGLRADGIPAMVSGAGPGVLVLTNKPDKVPTLDGWRRYALAIPEAGGIVARFT
jgi:homoserine kinase